MSSGLFNQAAGEAEESKGNLHSLEDLLSQSNENNERLTEAAEAEAYYGENDLAIDVLRNKYLAPE